MGDDPSPAASAVAPGEACLGEARAAERIGVDLFVMLDLSGSMLDPLPDSSALGGARTSHPLN